MTSDRLVDDLRRRESVLVAYSGGVDSALVASLAFEAVGTRALAVTAVTETLASSELAGAKRLADEIGIRHETVSYSELAERDFASNPSHRCYVCQGLRMGTMQRLARERGFEVVCDGTNASDPGTDRPGLRAMREQGTYSPLLAHGLDKESTRRLARSRDLSVWDKPANACLSSRVPHGQPITRLKLRKVEAAEELLLKEGFRIVRVRHDGTDARVEVGTEELSRLRDGWDELRERIQDLGFERALLDARGYRSGGADEVPVPALRS